MAIPQEQRPVPPLDDTSFDGLRRRAEQAVVEAFRGFGCSDEDLAASGVTVEDVKRMALTLRWKFFRPEQIKEGFDRVWQNNRNYCNNINPGMFAANLKWLTMNGFPPGVYQNLYIPNCQNGNEQGGLRKLGDTIFGLDPDFPKSCFLEAMNLIALDNIDLRPHPDPPAPSQSSKMVNSNFILENDKKSIVFPLQAAKYYNGRERYSDRGKPMEHFSNDIFTGSDIKQDILAGDWNTHDYTIVGNNIRVDGHQIMFTSPSVSRVVVTKDGYYTESAYAAMYGIQGVTHRWFYAPLRTPVVGVGILAVQGSQPPNDQQVLNSENPIKDRQPDAYYSYPGQFNAAAEELMGWWLGKYSYRNLGEPD